MNKVGNSLTVSTELAGLNRSWRSGESQANSRATYLERRNHTCSPFTNLSLHVRTILVVRRFGVSPPTSAPSTSTNNWSPIMCFHAMGVIGLKFRATKRFKTISPSLNPSYVVPNTNILVTRKTTTTNTTEGETKQPSEEKQHPRRKRAIGNITLNADTHPLFDAEQRWAVSRSHRSKWLMPHHPSFQMANQAAECHTSLSHHSRPQEVSTPVNSGTGRTRGVNSVNCNCHSAIRALDRIDSNLLGDDIGLGDAIVTRFAISICTHDGNEALK